MTPRERLLEVVRKTRPGVGDAIVIAHRGGAALAPENTLEAVDEAVRSGADVVEFDVQVTKDGFPVVIHDATVDRTTDGTGRVCDLTVSQVRALRCAGGQRIPLLDEMLDRVRDAGLVPMVEPKPTLASAPGLPAMLLRSFARHSLLGKAVVLSRRFDVAEVVGLSSPETLVAVMSWNGIQARAALASPWLSGIYPFWRSVSRDLVMAMHHRGFFVTPWTVDEPLRQEALLSLGVDGIVTDSPHVLREVVDRFDPASAAVGDMNLWSDVGFGSLVRLALKVLE